MEALRFNTFRASVVPAAWDGLAFLHRKQPIEKEVRAEIARLWRGRSVVAECGDARRGSWVLCGAAVPDDLLRLEYRACALDSVPKDVLLNFVIATRVGTPAGEPLYRTPSATYWEANKNDKRQTMTCLKPEFRPSFCMQALLVSASGFKVAQADFSSKKAVDVFTETASGIFESKGYRIPEAGEIVKAPPVRNSKPRLPWTPRYPEKAGPMNSKVTFIQWLVGEIDRSGLVRIEPVEIESRPIKELVGRRGMTSHLDKKKLLDAVISALTTREIHLYDRRTDEDNLGAWSIFSNAVKRACDSLGLLVVDHGAGSYVDSDAHVFVAIDRESPLDKDGDADTKQAAVASFPRPVQCFTGEIIARPSEDKEFEISPSAVLVMLANVVIKKEVAERRLILPREWLTSGLMGSVSDFVFCDGFADGEDKRYAGIHIDANGRLEFFEEPTEGRLYETVSGRQLTPVFRRGQSDPEQADFFGAIEIRDTPIRALPLLEKKGMSGHFTGVRVVEALSGYYASGSDNPKSLKVEKALVLRQVVRTGGVSNYDLEMMAGFCVDPTIRINAATVWPAPYKLLREYIASTPRN